MTRCYYGLVYLVAVILKYDCVSISALVRVIVAGTNPGSFQTFTSLICDISDVQNIDEIETRWRLPDDSYINISNGRFHIATSVDYENTNRTVLVITQLSYRDNGTYGCEVRQTGSLDSSWITDDLELLLLVHLSTMSTEVTTFNNETSVELSCDMAGFIPEDTALTWYTNNQLVSLDYRVSVSYRAGSFLSARGFNNVNKSTETTLTFASPQTTDSGIYECRIIGYEFLPAQTIVLVVEELMMNGETIINNTPTTAMPSLSTTVTSSQSATDDSFNGSLVSGLLGGLVTTTAISIIELLVLILLIVCILYCRYKCKTPNTAAKLDTMTVLYDCPIQAPNTTDTIKPDTVQYDTIQVISTDHSIHTTSNVAYGEMKL